MMFVKIMKNIIQIKNSAKYSPFYNSTKFNTRYKMSETVNRFLLTGDKLMHEIHLK